MKRRHDSVYFRVAISQGLLLAPVVLWGFWALQVSDRTIPYVVFAVALFCLAMITGLAFWLGPERIEYRVEVALDWPKWSRRSARGTALLAARLAGGKRDTRQAWLADLAGDPHLGVVLTPSAQRRLAAGFLVAAFKMRLCDLVRPFWMPVDWMLSTSNRTNVFNAIAVGALAIYIQATDGLHALLVEGLHPCAILGASLYGLCRWLRKIRGIELRDAAKPDRDDK